MMYALTKALGLDVGGCELIKDGTIPVGKPSGVPADLESILLREADPRLKELMDEIIKNMKQSGKPPSP